jgi:nucleotide-binding universal stress UspA family protein
MPSTGATTMRLKIDRICVPTDFSPAADHAVHYAAALARTYGSELHLLHVVEHSGQLALHPDFTSRGESTRVYLKQLEEAVTEAEAASYAATTGEAVTADEAKETSDAEVLSQLFERMRSGATEQMEAMGNHWWADLVVHRDIRSGNPAKEINHYVEVRGIDLVVIGSHGHSMLASVLLGSVTDRVVRTCGCPVTVIRHPEHRYQIVE